MVTMKKTVLATAIGLAFGLASAGASASTLTFANNTTPAAAPLPFTIGAGAFTTAYTAAFASGNEFRMISPATNTPGGGGEKSIYNGGEQWIFNGDSITGGTMTGVANTPSNPGASYPGSAAPTAGTNPTLGQPAPFFGSPFNFLAPTTTSLAGAAYGPATLSFSTTNPSNFTVHFPVMEAQWGGTWFPLGQTNNVGVNLNCTSASGNFTCFAEHKITVAEDPGSAGFATWVAQWDVTGTITPAPVPIPAAVWLFGSGLLGLVGIARRKRSA